MRSAAPAIAALLLLSACQTVSSETSDGRPMPPPARRAESAPPGAPINAISVLYAPKPSDSDANGRPDSLSIEVYLFARPYPTPVWREGTFTVSAFPIGTAGSPSAPGRKPVHVWKVATRDIGLGTFRSLIGEGYRFQLSLLEGGAGDRIPGTALDFVTSFEAAPGGAAVWSDGVRSISFEPTVAGAGRAR